jgi:hypothetical protein
MTDRPSPAALALFNLVTTVVWLQLPDGTTRELGAATGHRDACRVLGQSGLIRTGNWLPAYGPVVTATVRTPDP